MASAMDITNNVHPLPTQAGMNDNMDVDMDDIDLGLDDNFDAEVEAMNIEPINAPSSPSEAGEITAEQEAAHTQGADIAPEKIHVRGLDNLTTADVYAFASEHYPQQQASKVEWIDDTSANIVYTSTTIAGAALRAFTSSDLSTTYPEDPLEIRPAKPISANFSAHLSIRLALITDKKAPRAGDASRFYLMNPDKDPREQRRRQNDDRRRVPDRRKRRRDDEEGTVPFDENMYDDDPASLASRISRPLTGPPRRPRSADLFDDRRDRDHLRDTRDVDRDRERERERDSRNYKRTRRDEDLFADRPVTRDPAESGYGRLRDRSASPLRDGDGRLGFSEEASAAKMLRADPSTSLGRRIRTRSQTPPRERARAIPTTGPDLFANYFGGKGSALVPSTAAITNTSSKTNGEDDNMMGVQASSRELFPRHKPRSNGHQRKDAIDGKDDISVAGKGRDLFSRVSGGRSLADRISSPDSLSTSNGRGERSSGNASGSGSGSGSGGFNIRGGANQDEVRNPGFSIRGLGANHARVKELFPQKGEGKELFPNAGGKDLFEGRLSGGGGGGGGGLEGRITGRRRAEDLFS